LIALSVGGWYAWQHYEIQGLRNLRWARRDGTSEDAQKLGSAAGEQATVRVAAFNLQKFDDARADNAAVMEVICRTIRQFDIVALQGVRAPRPDTLRKLLDRVNENGRRYSVLVGPSVGRDEQKEQFLFVFDQATVETDRAAAYTVEDPDDLVRRPPLVGCFRVRGPATDQAFTFTLVNVHVDADDADSEIAALADALYRVRDDGRGEDDVIMLGVFHRDDQHLAELGKVAGTMAAIHATATNTPQSGQYDNLLFQLPATCEYMGRSGVYDFLRAYNLTLEQALEVSEHLPVWAEFSVYEGGAHPAIVAAQDSAGVR
jgi:endonuclease/exonuclease/phosphatase family metal-dependent hydrolase